jgi:hypothetical protein
VIALSVSTNGLPRALQVADEEALASPGGLVGCGAWRRLVLPSDDETPGLHIVTTRAGPPSVTANPLGPLILNPAARLGLQLILTDSPYATRRPLPLLQSGEGEAPHARA